MSTPALPEPPAAPGLAALTLALRSGAVTALNLAQACLARIDALEPKLQAFTHLDPERTLRHARAADQLRAAGVDLGPLMGVPVAVKDLFSIDGMPTHAGSQLDVQDLVPPQGSFIGMLHRAGCVLIGKTRTTEFALGGFNLNRPIPWNPCDPKVPRMTGGSSHGSAVAMAAGLAGFTVGSDTGGSVRQPAALCGVFGYKATTTHWPRDGVFPMSPLLDSVGIFTRSAHDAAWVEAALAGRALQTAPAAATLRFALPGAHFMNQVEPAVAACFSQALERLRRAGAQIVEIDVPEAAEIDAVFRSLVPADVLAFLGRERVTRQFDRLDKVAAQRLEMAMTLSADDYVQMATRQRVLELMLRERSHGVDAWLSPTVPVLPAPTAGFKTVEAAAAWNRLGTQNTRPGNLFNQCGVSLPVQHLGAEFPVGLQLCAPGGSDEALLRTAMAVEGVLGMPAAAAVDGLCAQDLPPSSRAV
jgi:aspartyl-tRNA(Asn)/glutamyl-tRNA(Gln) amidotransferase subunit A